MIGSEGGKGIDPAGKKETIAISFGGSRRATARARFNFQWGSVLVAVIPKADNGQGLFKIYL
jgi:hypothetical protein